MTGPASPSVPGWVEVFTSRPWLAALLAGAFMLLAVAGVLARAQLSGWRHARWMDGARWVQVAAPPEVDPASAAAVWTTLAGILTPARWQRIRYGTAHVAWEYTWTGRRLAIRLWVPGTVPPGAVEAAVSAAWPGATTSTAPAQAPIRLDVTEQAGGALWPQDTDAVPLRTDHATDPLRALLAAGATVRAHEHACVQVLARPASPRRVQAARRAARRITDPATGSRSGAAGGLLDTAARAAVEPLLWLLEVFLPGPAATRHGRREPAGAVRRDALAEAQRRPVVDKAAAIPHFEIAIRYAVATTITGTTITGNRVTGHRDDGPGADRLRQIRDRLAGLAHTLASAAAAYTRPNRLRRMRMHQPVRVLAERRLHRGFLATVEELAALAALPQDLAVPGLDRARAKAMPAPVAVPSGGRAVKVLGRAQVGGHAVGLNVVDARQHVHLVGKTGVGKSTLLLNMVLADVHARRGVVVIDPRGDLVTDILDRLPAAYADRIHLIDPDQPHPACFNPLDTTGTDAGGDPHLAVDNLVGIFSKIFQRHWGPRIDDTLRVSCLTLMRRPRPTLSMIPRLLNDRAHRLEFTAGLTDDDGLAGYWKWYDSMNDGLRAQVIGPVLARLRAFLLRDFVKDVIGTATSSFQMADILDGGILLCRLPKGQLGEDTARILGSLIVARTWQAAIARATIPETKRRDATLIIDECQNFLTLPGSVDDMLAEARGFRLGLVLAHQNLAQLPRETQAAVSANARTKVYFTVEPDDARELAKHTKPELSDHDLAHLDVHTAAARLLVDNRELPAFTFTTNPPPEPLGEAAAIRTACARRNRALITPAGEGGEQPPDGGDRPATPSRRSVAARAAGRRRPTGRDDSPPMRA